MARPLKNNADYFSHDNNMRNDPKIKAVRSRFGNEGHSIYCMTLETLASKEDFKLRLKTTIDWEILAGDFMIEVEKLKEIINYFIKIELVVMDGTNLICPKLTERLQPLLSIRERKREYRDIGKTEENLVIDGTNSIKDGTNSIKDGTNPQSKVKESKGNINTVCVLKKKSGEPLEIITGEFYKPDGFSPLQAKQAFKAMERALGKNKTNKWSQLLFGSAWDFIRAYQNFQGQDYAGDVITAEWAKTMAGWYEKGETRETMQEMIIAFFGSEKAEKVTITPNSVFSSHTYNSWKQGKLTIINKQKKWL